MANAYELEYSRPKSHILPVYSYNQQGDITLEAQYDEGGEVIYTDMPEEKRPFKPTVDTLPPQLPVSRPQTTYPRQNSGGIAIKVLLALLTVGTLAALGLSIYCVIKLQDSMVVSSASHQTTLLTPTTPVVKPAGSSPRRQTALPASTTPAVDSAEIDPSKEVITGAWKQEVNETIAALSQKISSFEQQLSNLQSYAIAQSSTAAPGGSVLPSSQIITIITEKALAMNRTIASLRTDLANTNRIVQLFHSDLPTDCPSGHILNPHSLTCLTEVTDAANWAAAKHLCESSSSYLVTFGSSLSYRWFQKQRMSGVFTAASHWIGAKHSQGLGWHWEGIELGALDYTTNIANGTNGFCLESVYNATENSYYWQNPSCGKLVAYICERFP